MQAAGFKTVLVAHDFSEEANRAGERATALPLSEGAVLVLVHCLEGRGSARAAEAQRLLEQEAARAESELAPRGCRVRALLVQGRPAERIISEAAAAGADLIVIGRGGRHGLRDVLLGSTAERVLEAAPCPVLLVHARGPRHYRRLMVAWDASGSAREGLALAKLLARAEQKEVEILHVYDTPYALVLRQSGVPSERVVAYFEERRSEAARIIEEQLRSDPSATPESWQLRLKAGDPGHTIVEEAEAEQADLIVLGRHSRSRLAHLIAPSVSDSVVRHAPGDVLVTEADEAGQPPGR